MEQHDNLQASDYDELADDRSAFDRFGEVFTSPSEAFAGLQVTRRKGSIILWGLIITTIIACVSVVLVMSNPTLSKEIRNEQLSELEEKRDKGDITDAEYEVQVNAMETFLTPAAMMISGIAFGVFGTAVFALIIAIVVYALVRILQRDSNAEFSYSTALAATLISLMISVSGGIIQSLGAFLTSSIKFQPSLALLVDSENAFLNFALGLSNPFTIWWLFVVGVAVALFARVERGKALGAVFGIYIVLGLVLVGIGELLSSVF